MTHPDSHLSPESTPDDGTAPPRREFFNDAFRQLLLPLSEMLDEKITPVLQALEFADPPLTAPPATGRTLDQPHVSSPIFLPPPTPPERYLRPPGAQPDYETQCLRCGHCLDACPPQAIRIDPTGLTAEGVPYVLPDVQPCIACEALPCVAACPTGALRLEPRDVRQVRMGTAKFHPSRCLRVHPDSPQPDCHHCLDVCPIPAALTLSAATARIRVNPALCIGCGLCEHACPTDPKALTILPPSPDPILA